MTKASQPGRGEQITIGRVSDGRDPQAIRTEARDER